MGIINMGDDTRLVVEQKEPDCYSVDFSIEVMGYSEKEWMVEIRGFLKWDGCINWVAGEGCMVHNCGPESLASMLDLFQQVYVEAKKLMGDKCEW